MFGKNKGLCEETERDRKRHKGSNLDGQRDGKTEGQRGGQSENLDMGVVAFSSSLLEGRKRKRR